MEIEIVVPDALVDEVVKAIMHTVRTGEIGDGRVFIIRVAGATRLVRASRNRRAPRATSTRP
jgi:nitrogen regulatory protein P-II 1